MRSAWGLYKDKKDLCPCIGHNNIWDNITRSLVQKFWKGFLPIFIFPHRMVPLEPEGALISSKYSFRKFILRQTLWKMKPLDFQQQFGTKNTVSPPCQFQILEGYRPKTTIKFWKVIELLNKIETPAPDLRIWKTLISPLGLSASSCKILIVLLYSEIHFSLNLNHLCYAYSA